MVSDVTLSKASRSRVEAALVHIGTHADLFQACSTSARRGRVVFSGGWASAAANMPPTPEQFREGRLMLRLARARSVNGAGLDTYVDAFAEVESESTLENVILAWKGGWFADRTFTAADPLGLVAHAEHIDRVDYFARKVFGLAGTAVQHIVASGEDRKSRGTSEETLYRANACRLLRSGDSRCLAPQGAPDARWRPLVGRPRWGRGPSGGQHLGARHLF